MNNSIKKGVVVAVILLFVSVSVFSSAGTNEVEKSSNISFDGNTLYVGGSGPNNYTKIQEAIDNASNDDTVFVYDDSSPYYEHVNVNKMINLVGEDRNTTIIDCGADDNVVDITANWVNISGFTIRNSGTAQGESGIKTDNQNNITISGNILTDNNVGILFHDTVDSFISDNIIIENRDVGIDVDGESRNNNVTNNIITKNPFGLDIFWESAHTIVKGDFIDNNGFGAGISSSGYIYKNTFKNNTFSLVADVGISGGDIIIEMNNFIENELGVALEVFQSYNEEKNHIVKNNFIGNKKDAGLLVTCYNKETFRFYLRSEMGYWNGNYWGDLRLFRPKAIWGLNVYIHFFYPPWPWPGGIYIPIPFPIIDFDRNPARKPYDIPEGEIE